jgi:hypothetical protein
MAVLYLERAGISPAIPRGEERFENMKLYRKRGCVEKPACDVNPYF